MECKDLQSSVFSQSDSISFPHSSRSRKTPENSLLTKRTKKSEIFNRRKRLNSEEDHSVVGGQKQQCRNCRLRLEEDISADTNVVLATLLGLFREVVLEIYWGRGSREKTYSIKSEQRP